jgi:hypothetical protein
MYIYLYIYIYICIHRLSKGKNWYELNDKKGSHSQKRNSTGKRGMYVCMYVCLCIHIYIYLYMYVYVYVYEYLNDKKERLLYIYVYIFMYLYIHTYTYSYIHIYILGHSAPRIPSGMLELDYTEAEVQLANINAVHVHRYVHT